METNGWEEVEVGHTLRVTTPYSHSTVAREIEREKEMERVGRPTGVYMKTVCQHRRRVTLGKASKII